MNTDAGTCSHITLYAADGHDREITVEQIDTQHIAESELLWIDLQGDDRALLDRIIERLQLSAEVAAKLREPSEHPQLENFGTAFLAQAVAVRHSSGMEFKGLALALLAGPNYVLSIHREPIEFLNTLRERERAETKLGALSAESFVASLLDWHIFTYFEAVSIFETAVDKLHHLAKGKRRVTLLYASRMVERNNATVLKELLEGMPKPPSSVGRAAIGRERIRRAKRL